MSNFEISFNSNLFNTFEYVVFDLVLAISVHVLTSKLVGLCNCYDAVENHGLCYIREDVRTSLFGTGIMSTKKKVFYVVVFVRILSWILIFSTNLLIRGRSERLSSARLTTLGGFSLFDPFSLLNQNRFLRLACMRRMKDFVYYGEIRNGTCEMNRELFTEPPVEFGLTFQPTLISTTGCISGNSSYTTFFCKTLATPRSNVSMGCLNNATNGVLGDEVCYIDGSAPRTSCVRNVPKDSLVSSREPFENVTFNCAGSEYQCIGGLDAEHSFSICDNAVVSCIIHQAEDDRLEGCAGLVNKDGVTRMCTNLTEGNIQNRNASCKIAKGLDWNITDWVPFYGMRPLQTISNVVAVAYGSGERVEQVKTYAIGNERLFTEVRYLWIGVLAAKIGIVLALFIACEVLSRRYGVFAVANDEPRLFSLLKTTVHRIRRGRNATTNGYSRLRITLRYGMVELHETDEE